MLNNRRGYYGALDGLGAMLGCLFILGILCGLLLWAGVSCAGRAGFRLQSPVTRAAADAGEAAHE
jgi:hypothetical protein